MPSRTRICLVRAGEGHTEGDVVESTREEDGLRLQGVTHIQVQDLKLGEY